MIAGGIHPRRADREIVDEEEKRKLLKKGKYAVIAMARDDDPYVVTLSYGYDEPNNRLYFHCALKGQKLEYLTANDKVCATVIEDRGYMADNCEHLFSSLIIRGRMKIVDELQEKRHGLDVLLRHLEDEPDPIRERNIKDDSSYEKVVILRLAVDSVDGKQYR